MLPETRQGLVTATAVVVATLLAFWLELDNPWWAAFSAHNISHGDRNFVIRKGLMRLAGTLFGIWLGYELAPGTHGNVLIQATALFVTIYFATKMRFTSQYDYAWLIFMLMIVMMMFVGIQEPAELYDFAYARILEVSLGVLVCAVINFFVRGGVAKASTSAPDKAHMVAEIERLALMSGCIIVAVPFLWSWLELPSMVQIAVTILAMVDRDLLQTREKSGYRILGCFAGGLSGLLVLGLGFDLLWAWALVLFVGVALAGRLYHSASRYAYVGKQFNLAFIITLVAGSGPAESIMPVLDRFSGIMGGVVLVVAASFLFAPKRVQEAAGR